MCRWYYQNWDWRLLLSSQVLCRQMRCTGGPRCTMRPETWACQTMLSPKPSVSLPRAAKSISMPTSPSSAMLPTTTKSSNNCHPVLENCVIYCQPTMTVSLDHCQPITTVPCDCCQAISALACDCGQQTTVKYSDRWYPDTTIPRDCCHLQDNTMWSFSTNHKRII